MSEPFYAPGKQPAAPRQRTPGTRVWSLQKDGRTLSCELRDNGEVAGVEMQLFTDGGFFAGRRFPSRALAAQSAEEYRADRAAEGWQWIDEG